jgi:hypothetical protein
MTYIVGYLFMWIFTGTAALTLANLKKIKLDEADLAFLIFISGMWFMSLPILIVYVTVTQASAALTRWIEK